MQINKFKYNPTKPYPVKVEYTVNPNDQKAENKFTLECKEELLDDHAATLQELSKYVTNICELMSDTLITITGISLSWSNDVFGCCIIAQMKLRYSTGVVNLVTPHRIETFYSDNGDSGQLMPDGMADLVYKIVLNVEKYAFHNKRKYQAELGL